MLALSVTCSFIPRAYLLQYLTHGNIFFFKELYQIKSFYGLTYVFSILKYGTYLKSILRKIIPISLCTFMWMELKHILSSWFLKPKIRCEEKQPNNDFPTKEEFEDDSHCQECACYPLGSISSFLSSLLSTVVQEFVPFH